MNDQALQDELNAINSARISSGNPAVNSIQDELNALNSQRLSSQKPTIYKDTLAQLREEENMLPSWAQVLVKLGGGVVGEVAGGLAGLGQLATGGSINDAVSAVGAGKQFFDYEMDKRGQEAMKPIASALEPVGKAFETVSRGMGDITYDLTGSEALAAAAYTAPSAIGMGLTKPVIQAGKTGLRAAKQMTPSGKALLAEQKALLLDDTTKYSGNVADVKLNSAKNVVPDSHGINMLESGWGKEATSLITKASDETKAAYRDMYKLYNEKSSNKVLDIQASLDSRIGKSVSQRIRILDGRRKKYGEALEDFVNGKGSNIRVDIRNPMSMFLSDINKNFGVKFKVKADGSLGVKEIGKLSLGTFGSARRLLGDVLKEYNTSLKGSTVSLKDAHKFKKLIDELMDADKAASGGLANNAHRNLLALRQEVNKTLNGVSGEYGKINGNLSSTITYLEPFNDYARTLKISPDNTDKVVGALLKDMGGDSKSAMELKNALRDMDKEVQRGGTFLKDDPAAMLAFKKTLADFDKITPDQLKKMGVDVDRMLAQNALDAAASLSVKNLFGTVHDVARMVRYGAKKKEIKKLMQQRAAQEKALKQAMGL